MAESSTCFVRSFYAPVDTNEGIPLRALGDSISFGRFMTETLDWEKWSTFTQKRYVEEAEKYSKPGSVAAKKAYFEAHYKRKAAEKAVALIQEANVQATAHATFDSENPEGNCTGSSIQVKSEADNIETANEQMNNKDTVNSQVVHCDGTHQYECGVGQSGLNVPEVEGAEDVHTDLNVLSCMVVDNSNQLDHVEDDQNISIPTDDKAPDLGIADQEALALPVIEVNSSKSLPKTRATKLSHSHETNKTTAAGLQSTISTSKKSVRGLVEKKGLTAFHMSINVPSGTSVANKTTAVVVNPSNEINIAPKSMKSVGTSMEKKPTAMSLLMSISVPSQTSKTGLVFEHNRNKKVSFNVPKDHPVASRTPTEASTNLPSRGRSCLKSSKTTKIIVKTLTISSPFRFRSEERAIKRKEFLQKMEETKSKEEQKVQLQRISKGKTEFDHNKLQHSSDSKSKLNEDRQRGSQSSSNQIRKFSLTVPQSPKSGRKASCRTVRDKNMENSQKPPISINNSKHITEKINQTRESGTSLSNTTRENASPNIQN